MFLIIACFPSDVPGMFTLTNFIQEERGHSRSLCACFYTAVRTLKQQVLHNNGRSLPSPSRFSLLHFVI